MDSRAIAVVIIGAGIMVLIVSAAIGAPSDEIGRAFSGWPAETHILPVMPTVLAVAAHALPLVEAEPRPQQGDNLACAVAIMFKLPAVHSANRNDCAFVGQYGAVHGWQCGSKFVHACIGDFPSTETRPPELQDTRNTTGSSVR